MAMHYFRRSDEHCYSDLQEDILEASYRDQNDYPKTLQREYDMLHRHTPYITSTSHRRKNGRKIPTSCLHIVKHQKIKGIHKVKNRYL